MTSHDRPEQSATQTGSLRPAPKGGARAHKRSSARLSGSRARRCLAALDVGTNSIRLLVVSVRPEDHSFTVVSDRKEVVRLGEGEYARNLMTP